MLRSLINFEGAWEIETARGEIWPLIHPGGLLNSLAGVGFPDATYATQKAPGQHGSTHLGYVVNDRTVQMGFDLDGRGGGSDCLVDVRVDWPYKHLNYLVNPLIIRRLLPGSVRELHDVWYAGGMGRSSRNVSVPPVTEGMAAQFVVRDPIWFDPTLRSYVIDNSAGATGDELVFDTPAGVVGPTSIFGTADYLTFGSSSINVTLNAGEIVSAGDWFTFPNIVITGPASYPEFENLTSGHLITMNYIIPVGRTVTFNLAYGYKTVRDDLNTNLNGYVPEEDDLADFCLWGTRQVDDGENDIRVFCGGATSTTTITIQWYNRYLGI